MQQQHVNEVNRSNIKIAEYAVMLYRATRPCSVSRASIAIQFERLFVGFATGSNYASIIWLFEAYNIRQKIDQVFITHFESK